MQTESVNRSVNSLWRYGLYSPPSSCPWNSPGKNTVVSRHSLLQGIFLTQGLNPDLLHCRLTLYSLSHQGLTMMSTMLTSTPALLCFFKMFWCGPFLKSLLNLSQFCFYVLTFWPWDMWDLSSPTRDHTCNPCIGRWSLDHWTTREVPCHLILCFSFFWFLLLMCTGSGELSWHTVRRKLILLQTLLAAAMLCGLLVASWHLELIPHRMLGGGLTLWTKSLCILSLFQKGRGCARAEEHRGRKDTLGNRQAEGSRWLL